MSDTENPRHIRRAPQCEEPPAYEPVPDDPAEAAMMARADLSSTQPPGEDH